VPEALKNVLAIKTKKPPLPELRLKTYLTV
jgi:hypothetical protein